MTPKCSPLAPLSTIQSVPLCQNDLIIENNGEAVDDVVVKSFDSAWSQLLQERGCMKGIHQEKLSALQLEAQRLKVAKDNLKVELTKQSAFVRDKRSEMETSYQHQFEEIEAIVGKTEEKAKAKLEMIDTAIESAALTLPWQHFMRELDRLASISIVCSHQKNFRNEQRFTSRAVAIASSYGKLGNNENPLVNQQRACFVEKALLMSHIQMLTLEIDRHEIVDALQREIGEELQNLHKLLS